MTTSPTSRRSLFALALAFSAAAAFALSGSGAAQTEPELARLLQFMALVKGLLSVGLGALLIWRVGHPTAPRFNLAYLTCGAMLFASPGVIWNLQHVVAGALLFHGGLFLLLGAAALDDGAREQLAQRGAARRGVRTPAIDGLANVPTSGTGEPSPTA